MSSPSPSPPVTLDRIPGIYGTRALDGIWPRVEAAEFVAVNCRSDASAANLLRLRFRAATPSAVETGVKEGGDFFGGFGKADASKYQVGRDVEETAKRLAAQK